MLATLLIERMKPFVSAVTSDESDKAVEAAVKAMCVIDIHVERFTGLLSCCVLFACVDTYFSIFFCLCSHFLSTHTLSAHTTPLVTTHPSLSTHLSHLLHLHLSLSCLSLKVLAWEEVMISEAANLADAPFGESLLLGISWAYENAADRYQSNAFSTSTSRLNRGSNASTFDKIYSNVNGTFNGMAAGSVGAVRHVERYVNLIGAGATVTSTKPK